MVRFMKASPTTYVLHFRGGRLVREGPGLAFFYWEPAASIVTVPLASADAPFAFQEATADFQAVAIQGQLTYRVRDPKRLATVLDLTVRPDGRYRTDDYQKIPKRLVHATQALMRQPIIAVNPDPDRFDGVLLPFLPDDTRAVLGDVVAGRRAVRAVTLAEARLSDGQRLLAFNELFVGARSHVSARYRLRWRSTEELQSSSGVLVATGAGSTGWLSSVYQMVSGIAAWTGAPFTAPVRMDWDDRRLVFVVREPFVSRHSTAKIVTDMIAPGQRLEIESTMPTGGVIFSDGIEADFLAFDAGAIASIGAAKDTAHLVAAAEERPGFAGALPSRRGVSGAMSGPLT